MTRDAHEVDAAIVGASLAGCSAALMLARAGLRVALIERSPDIDAYKRACTHLVHGSALPTLDRLGLTEAIVAAGGRLTGVDLWTKWGAIHPRSSDEHVLAPELNVRREILDPLLRRAAAEEPNVHLVLGHAATELIRENGGPISGVVAAAADGSTKRVRARLVIAADGRASRVAELAGMRARVGRNERFCYFGYYRGVQLESGHNCQLWFLDPEIAYAFPTDAGLTLLGVFPLRDKLPAFRSDPATALERELERLPLAPDISRAERVSPVIGKLDLPNIRRPAVMPGLALIGDAALAADPAVGVGCGWALQSAEWLADSVVPALRGEAKLRGALRTYARTHRSQLIGHHRLISEGSKAKGFSPVEQLFFSAATRDPEVARHVYDFATRVIRPRDFLAPPAVARALRARYGPTSAQRASRERMSDL